MHLRNFPRPRRLLTTVAACAMGFFILVNVLLRHDGSNVLLLKFNPRKERTGPNLYHIANDKYNDYVIQNQRKPKAANDRGYNSEIDHDDDEFEDETDYNASEIRKNTEEVENFDDGDNNYSEDIEKVVIEDDEYDDDDYSEDIEKVVIEDDDDDEDEDEDDDDNNYEEDYNNNFQMEEETIPPLSVDLENINIMKVQNETNDMIVKSEKYAKNHMNNPTKKKFQFDIQSKARTFANISKLVQRGIYWSSEVEKLIPKGFTIKEQIDWTRKIRSQKINQLKHPEWQKCGRPKNAFIVTEDGSWLCGRYRDPQNKLVLGEVLSFYLSQLLGVNNVPAVVLSEVNDTLVQWHGIDFRNFTWETGKIVALIQWIDQLDLGLSHVKIPPLILNAYKTEEPVTIQTLKNSSLRITELSHLVQWGNLFIFDYITGNYDRVASMQDAALQEKKPKVIEENIRNLRQSASKKKLWLIDNESGLLDAYELMYSSFGNGKNFIKFHRDMLQTMCIFDKNIVTNLKKLVADPYPALTLENYTLKNEPLIRKIKKDRSFKIFTKRFPERLKEVDSWIHQCMEKENGLR